MASCWTGYFFLNFTFVQQIKWVRMQVCVIFINVVVMRALVVAAPVERDRSNSSSIISLDVVMVAEKERDP